MKKQLILILSILVVASCKNNEAAKQVYESGVQKMNLTSDTNQRKINYQAALVDFDKATTLDPKFADAFAKKASIKWVLHDYLGSLSELKNVLTAAPERTSVYFDMGQLKFFHEDYQGAKQALNKFLSLNPQTSAGYYLRAQAEHELKEYANVIKDCDAAIDLTPKTAKNALGSYYYLRALDKENINDKDGACVDYKTSFSLGNIYAESNAKNCK